MTLGEREVPAAATEGQIMAEATVTEIKKTPRTRTRKAPVEAKPIKKATSGSVDLTRKTPWGTQYRIVRALIVGLGESGWVTICLEHDQHVASGSLRLACEQGTNGSVAKWCKKCAPLARKAATS